MCLPVVSCRCKRLIVSLYQGFFVTIPKVYTVGLLESPVSNYVSNSQVDASCALMHDLQLAL